MPDALLERSRILELALPVNEHAPAAIFELADVACIAIHGRQSFRLPEFGIRFRHNRTVLAVMGMPIAAMHQNHRLVLRKDEIGLAGQILPLQAEAQPEAMTGLPHPQLGIRVAALDARHVVCARRSVMNVHNGTRLQTPFQKAARIRPLYDTRHAFDDPRADCLDNVRHDCIAELAICLRVGNDLRKLSFVAE